MTLGEQYPKMQERLRAVIQMYKEIGPAGQLGLIFLEDLARRADRAAIEQDLPAMISCFKEMESAE